MNGHTFDSSVKNLETGRSRGQEVVVEIMTGGTECTGHILNDYWIY